MQLTSPICVFQNCQCLLQLSGASCGNRHQHHWHWLKHHLQSACAQAGQQVTGVPACERPGCTSARQAAARACLRTESAALRICGPRPNKSFAMRCATQACAVDVLSFKTDVEHMQNSCWLHARCIIACLSEPSYPVGFVAPAILQPPEQEQTQSSAVSLCTLYTRRLEALLPLNAVLSCRSIKLRSA